MTGTVLGADGDDLVSVAGIDHALPFWQHVERGRYRYVDADLTPERFSGPGSGMRTTFFTLEEFGELPDGNAAVAAIASRGFRPATAIETLAVCAAHLGLPEDGTLVALGTVWTDDRLGTRRYAASIMHFGGGRRIELHRLDHPWRAGTKALVTSADP